MNLKYRYHKTWIHSERLRYTIIKPKLKKSDKTLIQNYRPISVMTGFAKIFEMVVYMRLKEHLAIHKILIPQQYGFQKALSTEDAIYSLTNTILTAWNKKEYAVGIFCDIAKAFDCVDHDLLLMKLQYYGVQGLYLQWFKSYFQLRKQKVELNNVNNKYSSDWERIRYGVPQGSVLGPLLFNIYINDFPLEIRKLAEVIMFADDTSILCTYKDYNNLEITE
jgi:retron-type reverse transcriptase